MKKKDFLSIADLSAREIWQVILLAKIDAIFMHDMPAYRGNEVVAEVIDGPHSVIFQQAENRLHAQKALVLYLLGPSSA